MPWHCSEFVTTTEAVVADTRPTAAGLITLTGNEFRRLFDMLPTTPATTTATPSPNCPTTGERKTSDYELRLRY